LAAVRDQAFQVNFNSDISYENKSFLQEVLTVHHVIDVRRSQLEDIRKVFHDHGLNDLLGKREYLWDLVFPVSTKIEYSAETIKRHIIFKADDPATLPSVISTFHELINEIAEGQDLDILYTS